MVCFVLNTLDQELFASQHQKATGKIKSYIFYYTVLGLSVVMLFKGIASKLIAILV